MFYIYWTHLFVHFFLFFFFILFDLFFQNHDIIFNENKFLYHEYFRHYSLLKWGIGKKMRIFFLFPIFYLSLSLFKISTPINFKFFKKISEKIYLFSTTLIIVNYSFLNLKNLKWKEIQNPKFKHCKNSCIANINPSITI